MLPRGSGATPKEEHERRIMDGGHQLKRTQASKSDIAAQSEYLDNHAAAYPQPMDQDQYLASARWEDSGGVDEQEFANAATIRPVTSTRRAPSKSMTEHKASTGWEEGGFFDLVKAASNPKVSRAKIFPRDTNRSPRPTRWDSTKEIKPLFLVGKLNSAAAGARKDEYPALPDSEPPSRGSPGPEQFSQGGSKWAEPVEAQTSRAKTADTRGDIEGASSYHSSDDGRNPIDIEIDRPRNIVRRRPLSEQLGKQGNNPIKIWGPFHF